MSLDEKRLEEIREYQKLPKGHLERYEMVEDLLAMVDSLRAQERDLREALWAINNNENADGNPEKYCVGCDLEGPPDEVPEEWHDKDCQLARAALASSKETA